ncbi:LOW QUALITY PROTEIN: E-beta-ocimene/myrcene synthase [Cinnamomum micranthum f. kanehirae]|uniref:E-beta-ocimene/myrcene synthase n=1 Tax=Cinnamomum micranthum f. kanehirae TaxID=337451 RepID=A0A443Q4N6_9MAGN|nr:LOW QUALITY PROTEIN: E-beta-ocimene/myrcene synthase [Cinnamomum micranthum f. kanehirae]
MKICFLALYNTTNQMGYEILKRSGNQHHSIPTESDLCKAMLVEAKWYYSGYKPSLEEYLNNGWVSSSGPVILVHAFLLSKLPTATQVLDGLDKNPGLIRWPKPMFPKWMLAIISKTSFLVVGRSLNEEVRTASPYPPHFHQLCLESCKVHCIYQHGDGHTVQDRNTKDRLTSLLVRPIPLVVE